MDNLVPPSYESRIELLDHSWARREIGSIDRGERDHLQTARSSRVRHKVSLWKCSLAAQQWRWLAWLVRLGKLDAWPKSREIDRRGTIRTSALGVGSTRKGGSEHSAVKGKCNAKSACRLRGKSQSLNNCLNVPSSDTLPCLGLARPSCRNPYVK